MINQILQAAQDLHKIKNIKATTAYLGHRQYAEAINQEDCKYTVTGHHEDGFFIAGIRLINVNENDHFRVV